MSQRLQSLAIVAGILLIGLVAFVRMGTALAWGIIPLIIAVPWMLGDPKRLLAGYWLWATVTEYVYQVSGIGALRYGDEALLLAILIAMVFIQALNRTPVPDLRGMIAVFWILMVILFVSHMINKGSHIDAGVTAVQYYRPFVLGFFAYILLKPDDFPGVASFFILTLTAQLVMNLGWLLEINPFPHPGVYVGVDFAVGTMGSSLFVGYTACIGIVLCLAIFLVCRLKIYVFWAALISVSFVLTNTAHAYAFLALMLLSMVLIYSRGAPMRLVAAGLAAVPIISVLVLIQVISPLTLRLDTYLKRGTDLLTGRKVAAYRSHLVELPIDPAVPLFLLGTGPGSLGTAMADQRGYLASKYHGWSFTGPEIYEVESRSIIMVTRTGLLAIWSDLGPLAFLLYWGSHLYALLRVVRNYQRSLYEHPWQKAFALAFIPVMVLYLLVAFMTDIVHTALWGCIPWIWASFAWTPARQEVSSPEVEQLEDAGFEPDRVLPAPVAGR